MSKYTWHLFDLLSKNEVNKHEKSIVNLVLTLLEIAAIVTVSGTLISIRSNETTLTTDIVKYDTLSPITIKVKAGWNYIVENRNVTKGEIINFVLNGTKEFYTKAGVLGADFPYIETSKDNWANVFSNAIGITARYFYLVSITIINDTILNNADYYYNVVPNGMDVITCMYPDNITSNCRIFAFQPDIVVTIITKKYSYDILSLATGVGGIVSFVVMTANLLSSFVCFLNRRCCRKDVGVIKKDVELEKTDLEKDNIV
jgi:hypothetical protein